MSDIRVALSLLFDRFNEDQVPETELTKVMSLTLGWCKPSQAPNLLHQGVNAGILGRSDDLYWLAFDPGEVDVPFGFEPKDHLFEPVEAPAEAGTPPAPQAEPDATAEPAPEPEAPVEEQPPAPEPAPEPVAAEPSATEGAPPAPAPEGGPEKPLLETLLDAIAPALGGSRKEAVAAVNSKQEALEGIVTLEAAALLVAAQHGVDVVEHARALKERLGQGA